MKTACQTCSGDGRVRESKKINLRVPAGVDEGSRLRVRGEGNCGKKGGEYGDLYVFINVKADRGAPRGLISRHPLYKLRCPCPQMPESEISCRGNG